MHTGMRIALGLLLLLGSTACEQAKRYGRMPSTSTPTTAKQPDVPVPLPLDPRLIWDARPDNRPVAVEIPIVFVSQPKNPQRWAELPQYWNPSLLADPRSVAMLATLTRSPLEAATILAAGGPTQVEVKVPLGLDDPTPFIPPENPPTLGAWLIGRRLFFDSSYLSPEGKSVRACASCHDSGKLFASSNPQDFDQAVNTPSLLNVVYRPRLFWDGRGESLEQSLQRLPEDERGPSERGSHIWPGAIRRLYDKQVYIQQCGAIWGVYPNQEIIGRSLATYLRTLLAGNSLHDRVMTTAKGAGKAEPEAAHYQGALTEKDLVSLGRDKVPPVEVAQELHRGYLLYHDKIVPNPTACIRCHGGSLFSDNGFHNLSRSDELPGRFATLPLGKRTADMLHAFRTPSLRDVARTGPYFHPGDYNDLRKVVEYHLEPRWSSYLDPAFRQPGNPARVLARPLLDADRNALVLFLRSLNSEDPPLNVLVPPY